MLSPGGYSLSNFSNFNSSVFLQEVLTAHLFGACWSWGCLEGRRWMGTISAKLDSFLLKIDFCCRLWASNKEELSLTPALTVGVSVLFGQYSKYKTSDPLVPSERRTRLVSSRTPVAGGHRLSHPNLCSARRLFCLVFFTSGEGRRVTTGSLRIQILRWSLFTDRPCKPTLVQCWFPTPCTRAPYKFIGMSGIVGWGISLFMGFRVHPHGFINPLFAPSGSLAPVDISSLSSFTSHLKRAIWKSP